MSRRTFTRAAAGGAVLAMSGAVRVAHAQPAANTAYLMTYFTESPNMVGADYGLHLAVSRDGLNWTPLNQNNPVVTPTAGDLGLRDPFVFRKQDGTFVVVATDLRGTDFTRNSQYLHVWDSTNLTSFSGYRRVRMHTLNTHTWAPIPESIGSNPRWIRRTSAVVKPACGNATRASARKVSKDCSGRSSSGCTRRIADTTAGTPP